MSDIDRKRAIEILKTKTLRPIPFDNSAESSQEIIDFYEALNMAISSLEADEAYQLEYETTTKNDLGVDYISRQAVIDELKRYFHDEYYQRTSIQDCRDCFIEDVLNHLPSVTPQPQTFKWCTNCKEYDQEKHCCHRWSKVIRDTVEEMKQGYIKREVLDKIRAEIEKYIIPKNSVQYDYESKWQNSGLRIALEVIDKYKGENNG